MRCLVGLALLLATPFAGSFGWMLRLLGFIGVANGTAHSAGVWFVRANRVSTAAVIFLALAQIAQVTGLLPAGDWQSLLSAAFTAPLVVCLLAGLRKHNQEGRK